MGSNTCEISDGIATKGNGSYRNVLLAQTITLGLNLRVPGSSLASLPITGPYLVTLESNGSGCNDPASTPVAGTEIVRVIPDAVLAYLGSANTVGDLFALANRVLGADTTLAAPVPSLSAINQAVSAFNEGFDECRYFAGFYSTNPLDTVMSTTSSRLFNQAGGLSIEAYPNPAASNMVFSFSLSGYSSRAVLEILDINGARVAELFNRTADADYTHQIRFDTAALAEGIYFYRLTTDRGILTEKLSVLR
jgi:hypothetical protein